MTNEQIPTTWSDADEAFFRVVAHVFSSGFAAGASVLLASYDQDDLPTVPTVHRAGPTEARSSHPRPVARTIEARR